MTEERWWILNPIGHRQAERIRMEGVEEMEFLGQKVPIIFSGITLPDDMWVCDYCNGDIPIRNDHELGRDEISKTYWVPMMFSNALCPTCMNGEMTSDEMERFHREHRPQVWSTSICGCDGCKPVAEAIWMQYRATMS